jgi:hypothetical protein
VRICPYRSESLGTVVLPGQVGQLDAMRTAALEEEINQRIQQLKAAAVRAEGRGDRAGLESIHAQRVALTAWHQRLLARRQQLREQRHRVFSEEFVQVAKEHLEPELLERLVTTTQERLTAEASAPVRQAPQALPTGGARRTRSR